ncbi:putative transcriptional regulator, MerR-family [Corynebacterium glutamicum MB001]|uniref:Predicted transcriptional regulators n=1 Tax=Corynebacterium glutamicum (strain ATCC 13032 / DSM 20300 / JCM 1318 / BCRC 11384 / CCUG 27702 / LMG 3730 / NBRC 12168 / NCIMB 10025 / NRRL B-2784 / 534) TaxID=196627 RepID=Q8NLY9_CORGL|nr:helix-turn-helix transcriptional regulator [Corynebacterium glutamicum]AGT06508.1 putative transcriptional regulator, MerR-family [Corynebacterium glutamicum MB001]ARV66007.1 transcriptional regulator [Corynebacterium glutamicum]ASW15107.1 putative transcriptional regulator, MerR-family [Corynebacterium glutamicum]AUI02180.1 transcriptional regulator [Corynebacterium glutamicum]AUI02997.1 transcriptional regulator [Corynebacterium glutamicum]
MASTPKKSNDEGQFDRVDFQGEVFVISVAAELAGMHAQTLRTYDRMGLVTPIRTRGGGRRYSRADVELLREIQHLSQEEGVNLAGIKAIIELGEENRNLKESLRKVTAENEQLKDQLRSGRPRGELVHVPRSTAVVMWERRKGRSK